MSGRLVRQYSSTSTPFEIRAPAALRSSTSGSIPMPATTKSHSNCRPDPVTTRSTRSPPSSRSPPSARRRLNPFGVFHCAQIKDTFPVSAWKPQLALAATGGDQNSVVGDNFAVVETNLLRFRFKLFDGPAEHEFDPKPLVFSEWGNERVCERFRAPQKPFRQWRALIRQMRLRGDERDVSIGLQTFQLERCVAAGQAAADDHDRQCLIHGPAGRSEYWRRSAEPSQRSRAR